MQSFKVDTTEIGSASTNIGTLATNIETDVAAMMRVLTNLETTWSGSASVSFAGLRDEWKRTQDAVREDLKAIGLALGKAGISYLTTEQENQRNLKGSGTV